MTGLVLARSFHSVLSIGYEVIKQALGGGNVQIRESQPEMTWNRMEYSVMLEHVQAHVAPTDVDPGAGLQWLPKIRRSSLKVKRFGALLERVFMPCDMYFRYTRHKVGTANLKVSPVCKVCDNLNISIRPILPILCYIICFHPLIFLLTYVLITLFSIMTKCYTVVTGEAFEGAFIQFT